MRLTDRDIARVCHEANRAYALALGEEPKPSWACAPEEHTEAVVSGVRFLLTNELANAADAHEAWLKLKAADGWVYGPEINPELRHHPCMLPWLELSVDQRRKDVLFVHIVRALQYDTPAAVGQANVETAKREATPSQLRCPQCKSTYPLERFQHAIGNGFVAICEANDCYGELELVAPPPA